MLGDCSDKMGEDCGTWIPNMQLGWQSPNLNPLDVGKLGGISAAMNPAVNMVSAYETIPAFASSALQPRLQLGCSSDPRGWFYCLPRFRQEFSPAPNFTVEGKTPFDHVRGFDDKNAPFGESSSPRKQFLVIDQTADQTTVVYSSRFGSPCECLASWHSKLHGGNNWRGDEPSFKGDLNLNSMNEPTLADKVHENHETSIESEMHEDTEEINALLYSDSDDYSAHDDDDDDDDDDEVTSTGHSPSTMTTHDDCKTSRDETVNEVASSAKKTKKRKLLDGCYDDIQLTDTASSQNMNKSSATCDDSESRCSSNNNGGSLSSNKKMKKEKIQDVLSILQSIIPGGKDKGPVMLLDDAIRSLKSLKQKAQALGLDALHCARKDGKCSV
ncbi:hypothetical protein VIGAN_02111800 [Vigna angularis var. angularis]|uniref:BHLH domain-containing protein n=2 Tax=Phaseolus angularis TaxID=3914 RepID=A0A0S3RD26_PHAAN|nr:transcription factor bHLH143 [Vigna angularis]BAT78442.1 hypothetical protein VIGAN_02111800 [Vigna angularis var. angularis]